MDYKFLAEVGITVAGWCVMLGIYTQKIKQHDLLIKEIKEKQAATDTNLQEISNVLSKIDTKVDLLLNGKINTSGDGK